VCADPGARAPIGASGNFGPSGVRALPLAAGINVGGHYKWYFWSERSACASGQHLGGLYFAYINLGLSIVRAPAVST
jgi:hypothetical protein